MLQCSVGIGVVLSHLHLAETLSIWEFPSPAGSISEKRSNHSEVLNENKEDPLASCWLVRWYVSRYVWKYRWNPVMNWPCASLWVGISSSSSSSPHRFLGYWGPERSLELQTVPFAASRPSPPSDETNRENAHQVLQNTPMHSIPWDLRCYVWPITSSCFNGVNFYLNFWSQTKRKTKESISAKHRGEKKDEKLWMIKIYSY